MAAISHFDQAPLLDILEIMLFGVPMFCNLQKTNLQNMLWKKIIRRLCQKPLNNDSNVYIIDNQ